MTARFTDDQPYYNHLYGSNHQEQPPRYNNARTSSYHDRETPRYPNLTKSFHNNHSGAPIGIDIHDEYPHYYNKEDHRHHAPAAGARREKVRFAEYEETSDHGREKRGYKEKSSVDSEAEDYIKLKHKLFATARFNTYKE